MKKLICFTLLFVSVIVNAQNENGLWKRSNSSKVIINDQKSNLPQKNIFNLDFESLKKALKTSPKRDITTKYSNTIITIPTADGKMEKFEVYENSVMAPELAAKYPEIKSYVGVSVENPSVRTYFSCSPLGFKSMTTYPNKETVFIEPVNADNSSYTVYNSSDRKQAFSKFECGVVDDAMDIQNLSINTFARGADNGKLTTLRLALACTGEYAALFGGTKALALAGINNTITRVSGVYERDFGVKLMLVANNDAVIYTNASTDPFSTMANWKTESQANFTSVIGEANYDLGHLFGTSTANGGDAGCVGCVGVDNQKGRGVTFASSYSYNGDNFDIDYVAHEIGHQLGANHTFTYKNEGSIAQIEPGSGTTVMSYAGVTSRDIQMHHDAYFHAISIQQVTDNIKSKIFVNVISTGNATPVVNAGLDYTIPNGTPFMLNGSATDSNTDNVLTYSWEQMDLGNATASTPTSTATVGPLFRSYPPVTSSVRYFPNMNTILAGSATTSGLYIPAEVLPTVARTLNFRLTVRDNRVGGGANNTDDVIVTVDGAAGPFSVDTQNTATSYVAGTSQNINWTVAGTNANGVNCANVDILLSTDGGLTFPTVLVSGTPNDGTQVVVIPNIAGTKNRIMVKGSNHIFFDVNNADFTITGSGSADSVAPASTVVSASGTTTSATNLSWNGSSDNIGVSGYKVYQNGVLKTTTTATTLAVTGLSASAAYGFYVTAYDAAGNNSAASNTVNVTTLTPADATAPTSTVVSASGTTTSGTNLSWNVSSDNVGVSGYKVYQNGMLKTTTTATSLVVSGLSASTTYSFYVTAYDAAGNNSIASNTVNVTTLTPTDTTAPTSTVVSASGTTISGTNLSWNVSSDNVGVVGYKVYQNGVLKTTTTTTSLVVSGLSASTTYSFYVTAYDAVGNNSVASNTVNVTTLGQTTTYCNSNGTTANEFINRVQIGTINNLSGNNGGYGNFTAMSTNVNIGSLVSISISSGWVSASYAEAFNVWIDYNKNGSFESNELVYSKAKSKAATVSGSFTIPSSALVGTTRMRVSMKFNAYPSACEVFTRGEVEDYTINIVNGGVVKTSDVSASDDENTEIDTVEVKDNTTVATDKVKVEELSFKLYPNPVKDGVIYFSGLTNDSSYKIFNQMGQQLGQGTIENDNINVSSLSTGIYFVQVTNNSAVGVKRFIKE